jgi:PAS domain S-box-containing protein
MYTLDTGGYFQTINNAGLKALGCTKEDVIGSHISRWLTPESLRASMELLQKQISGEDQFEQPAILEIICKNGDHRLAEIRTRVIREGDRITGVHGIARDVTEKKRLEQKVREYHETLKKSCEDLIEADRIKTEFISNITHELLTPLTSISGFTELLYDETTGKINNEQKKSLQIILRNSDRLIRLIKDLLDVSHLEKNKLGMQFGLISIGDVISRCMQDLQPQAKYKEITISQDIKPLPKIWGDEGRLTQVIANLLANAIKFTPQKGTITVIARESQNEVKISITDTGIGIPHDQLSRIFERFYQIDGSNSRKYGGAGLGLSICKSIVENHYGSIWAESDGNGSTFHIVLPKLECIKKTGL